MKEPIAWINKERDTITFDNLFPEMTPLYEKREWVGLTDEEMLTLEETTTCTKDESWLRNLTHAIEQALKDKNT